MGPGEVRLVDVDATTFPDGTLVFVRSVRDFFVLDKASALTADDTTIADAIGGGQWLRMGFDNERWTHQAAWFIDPAAADDEGDGSAGDPLRTHAELGRRAMNNGAQIPQSVTVTIVSTLPADTDPVEIDVELTDPTAVIRYVGTPTQIESGTLSAATPLVSGTNLPDVTGPGLFLGDRIRLTSGASTGAIAWILRDDGGGVRTTSAFQTTNKTAQPLTGTPTLLDPAANDDFVVEDLPNIYLARVKFSNPNGVELALVFDSLHIGSDDDTRLTTLLNRCLIVDSVLDNVSIGHPQATMSGCLFDDVTLRNGFAICNACASRVAALSATDCFVIMAFETTAVGAPLVPSSSTAVYAFTGPVSAHDSPALTAGLTITNAANAFALLWGTGNATYGINALTGSLFYPPATKPTVTGGTNDTRVGGVDKAYADIPFLNGTNGAAIVETPT